MTVSRHSRAFGSLALALLIACSACSSNSTPTVATLGQQVLTITSNTNKALAKDRSKNAAKTNDAYSKTFKQAANQFKALDVPASIKPKAKALVTALDTMSTLAAEVGKLAAKNQNVLANVTAMADKNLKLMEEEKVEKTASNALRKALGLPAEATTTTTAPPSTTIPVGSSPTTTPSPGTTTSS